MTNQPPPTAENAPSGPPPTTTPRPAHADPDYRHEYDEDGNPHDPSAGWDLAFGCRISFGTMDGVLRASVHMSDHELKARCAIREVTPEQIRAFANDLLHLLTELKAGAPVAADTTGHTTVQTALWEFAERQGYRFEPHTLERFATVAINAMTPQLAELETRLTAERQRTHQALAPLLREHPLTQRDVHGDNLSAGYLAESARDLIRHQAAELEQWRSLRAELAELPATASPTAVAAVIRSRMDELAEWRRGHRTQDGTASELFDLAKARHAEIVRLTEERDRAESSRQAWALKADRLRADLARAHQYIGGLLLNDPSRFPTTPEQAAERVVDLDPPPAGLAERSQHAVRLTQEADRG